MKERIQHHVDFFIDFEGNKHQIVLVAISTVLPNTLEKAGENIENFSPCTPIYYQITSFVDDYGTLDFYEDDLKKVLSIGVAICNPEDNFDLNKGIAKATGRARKNAPIMWVNKPGIINTKMVKALLEQEADYIKDNPDTVIKGYSEREKKYLYNKSMQKFAESLDNTDTAVIDKITSNKKYLNSLFKYISWLKK